MSPYPIYPKWPKSRTDADTPIVPSNVDLLRCAQTALGLMKHPVVLNVNPLELSRRAIAFEFVAVAFEGTAAFHMRLPFHSLRTLVYAITATIARTPHQDHPNTQCSPT
jgi:hypothetical protein